MTFWTNLSVTIEKKGGGLFMKRIALILLSLALLAACRPTPEVDAVNGY